MDTQPQLSINGNYIRADYDTPIVVRVNGVKKSLDKEDALTMRAQLDFKIKKLIKELRN